jgi:hypothetical protein
MVSSGKVFLMFLGVIGLAILVGGGGVESRAALSRVHGEVVRQGSVMHRRVERDVRGLSRSCRRTYEQWVSGR